MRACPLTTTAVSSTKTQSGSCSSGGSSTTSSPNRRRVLTYSECCCFAFSRLITPFVPTAFFSKESGKRQTTAWVNLKALAMFYCFFPLSTRLLFCATGGLRGRQHTHTHTTAFVSCQTIMAFIRNAVIGFGNLATTRLRRVYTFQNK